MFEPALSRILAPHAAAVVAELPPEWIAYALDPARGAYRGYAALADRCDENDVSADVVTRAGLPTEGDDGAPLWCVLNCAADPITAALLALDFPVSIDGGATTTGRFLSENYAPDVEPPDPADVRAVLALAPGKGVTIGGGAGAGVIVFRLS